MIVSRASGAPLIAGAIRYAAQLVRGKIFEVAKKEFEAANKAGLKDILAARKAADKPAAAQEEVTAPPKEVVTSQIAGIEIMDLEDGVKALWKIGVYAAVSYTHLRWFISPQASSAQSITYSTSALSIPALRTA